MICYIVFIDFFAVPTSDIQKDIDQYFFWSLLKNDQHYYIQQPEQFAQLKNRWSKGDFLPEINAAVEYIP